MPESFVCNIGDMLDRMTGGLYRSTPHRVRLNTSGRDRLSFPLFFDPDFDARIEPIRSAATDDHATRWDGASVHAFEGTYGDYLLGKVGKVFPDLRREVLPRVTVAAAAAPQGGFSAQPSQVRSACCSEPGSVIAMYATPAIAPAMCASWLTRPKRARLAITL